MGKVNDRVALVSGGARGMGASHARLLIEEGASVVIGDVLDDEGKALVAELGDRARYVHLDVTRPEDWENAVATAVSELGSLDILVNNAGIVRIGDIESHSIDDWHQMIAVNLTGVFLGMKTSVPELKKSGNGSIVNISSIAGLQGFGSMSSYNASKYGVRGLTKSAAIDLGPFNVRVNSIHPGLIKTPMTEGADQSQQHVAMKRGGDPIEVSRMVLFLASDDSSFSTGSEFVIDGGETAGLAQNAVFH
ncbi:SDR family oxidoreductase [Rhodococcus sp. Eu-32]|uniref:glucose 1-dehydrogenase n=1 Tax=Rhodococcus sp. Eu-32 TaxID=1017319 RepID=UPI000DF408B1|nr:glucose 1-dehydrogenase [Rhodococcus sp. Eu-32]RRQ25616.1 SDR family oxidoreductase [Rhodococcus sp. Eu-32]